MGGRESGKTPSDAAVRKAQKAEMKETEADKGKARESIRGDREEAGSGKRGTQARNSERQTSANGKLLNLERERKDEAREESEAITRER